MPEQEVQEDTEVGLCSVDVPTVVQPQPAGPSRSATLQHEAAASMQQLENRMAMLNTQCANVASEVVLDELRRVVDHRDEYADLLRNQVRGGVTMFASGMFAPRRNDPIVQEPTLLIEEVSDEEADAIFARALARARANR